MFFKYKGDELPKRVRVSFKYDAPVAKVNLVFIDKFGNKYTGNYVLKTDKHRQASNLKDLLNDYRRSIDSARFPMLIELGNKYLDPHQVSLLYIEVLDNWTEEIECEKWQYDRS